MQGRDSGSGPGLLTLVGIGPGSAELLTPAARKAVSKADFIIGYRTYLDQIRDLIRDDQQVAGSSMMQEIDRCKKALKTAAKGGRTALICGGDPGIYSMAGLVFELARSTSHEGADLPQIEVIPGVAALNACAALLGAPLMHDFAAISLSDLLTPWQLIEERLHAAASADFVLVIYNPASRRRKDHMERARRIIMKYRPGTTPAGVVRAAYRQDQSVRLTTLEGLKEHGLDMQCTVIIGNSKTFTWAGRIITPRGYGDKYGL